MHPLFMTLLLLVVFLVLPLAAVELWDAEFFSAMIARHKKKGYGGPLGILLSALGVLWYFVMESRYSFALGPLIFLISFPLFLILLLCTLVYEGGLVLYRRVLVPLSKAGAIRTAARAAKNKAFQLRRVSLFAGTSQEVAKELKKEAREQLEEAARLEREALEASLPVGTGQLADTLVGPARSTNEGDEGDFEIYHEDVRTSVTAAPPYSFVNLTPRRPYRPLFSSSKPSSRANSPSIAPLPLPEVPASQGRAGKQ